MPLVNAKCTNCGANLEVDSAKDAANCPYCGAAYIVEKAINNYNITNNTTNNISADVVNVYGGNSGDFVIRGGVLEKYTGAATEVVIPNNVTIIGTGAFSGCVGVTSVKIPESVRDIRGSAFWDCENLTEITLPDTLQKISSEAFRQSGISHLVIPQTVTYIGRHAFYGCRNLKEIVLPENVSIIEAATFVHCENLQKVTILGYPEIKPYNDGDSFIEDPFYCCNQLTTIIAPEEWKKENCYKVGCLANYRSTTSTQNKGSCYIATAVYGSYDCPQVWTLRRYRDNYLAESVPGRLFIRSYYAISPTIVRWFKDKDWFQRFWRDKLDKKVYKLNQKGYKDTPYSDK